MKKKKITFVISNLGAGGAQRVLSTLVNTIISEYNITIISLYADPPFYHVDSEVKILFCSKTYNDKPTFFESINNHLKLFKTVCNLIKNEKPDVIIGFMTTSNIYSALASKLLGIPSIISERNNPESSDNSYFWLKIRRLTYPIASKVVVQTATARTYFSKFLNTDRLVVISNPLSPDFVSERNYTLKKEKVILNVGRLIHSKNQDLLIKAFSEIYFDDWKLVFAGEGEQRVYYEKLTKSLNLQDRVQFIGNISNISDYYNISEIFVFTSTTEGFPNALIEAMYFGLPSISTDCPSGPSELIKDGENGFLIPVGDEDMLKKKLLSLMKDDFIREIFSRNGKITTKKFEPDSIVNEWKSIIENLINLK